MLGLTAPIGTVPGQSGGHGGPARGHVGWVTSRGSALFIAREPMARGAVTSWEETWIIASVTSDLVEVSKHNKISNLKMNMFSILTFISVTQSCLQHMHHS